MIKSFLVSVLTLAVFLLSAGLASASGQAPMCEHFFADVLTRHFAELDSTSNRRFYYQYVNKNAKNETPKTIEPRKVLDRALLGVFGQMKDFVWDPVQKKMIVQDNPEQVRELRQYTEALLEHNLRPVSEEVLKLVSDAVKVTEISNDSVMVSVPLLAVGKINPTGFSQALVHRYQRAGSSVVDFIYRASGLEGTKPLTGFTMLDEMIDILKQKRGYTIHLVYDKAVWEKDLQMISIRYEAFKRVTTKEDQDKIIGIVNQATDPFLPTTGIVTTDNVLPGSPKPVELKRYFQNPFPDPLGMLNLAPKNEFRLRHEMLYQVISAQPAGTSLEIHAHSVIHMRAYLKLGFTLFEKTENPLYPGVVVNILRGTREQVLAKIKAILDKTEAGG